MIKRLAMVTALSMGLMGGLTGGVTGAARAQGIDPIQTRQVGLDLLSGTFGGVKAVITANGDVKTLVGAGKAIARWGKVFPTLFPAGSDKGETKAAPAIWSDNAGFQKASMALSEAGGALATAAAAGDAAAAAVAFKAIGEACGACHKDYRLK